jgi:chromosome partitioning protein
MRRIAIINQKGGVGKTTTSVNLGAALAEQGRRVVVADLDPQANMSLHLGIEPESSNPSTYTVLHGATTISGALHDTNEPNLRVLPSNIDLSGAELELASAIGRDNLLSDAIEAWEKEHESPPADYMIFDCPPSLGLLSINALAATNEVIITVQTEFLALMGMSKLVEVVTLIQRRLNPNLKITGIAPCLYDSRLRLAREVLAEIRKYFPGQVFRQPIRSNVKLAEAPSFGASILEYAPESNGALDYRRLALEVIEQEKSHPDMADLSPPRELASLPTQRSEEGVRAAEEPADDPDLPQVTLKPQAPPVDPAPSAGTKAPKNRPKGASGKRPRSRARALRPRQTDAVEEELRIMRSQDLPPLPPEAFEVDHG